MRSYGKEKEWMEMGLTWGTLKLMAISSKMKGRLGAWGFWFEGLATGELLGVLELLVEVAAGEDEIWDGEWQGRGWV